MMLATELAQFQKQIIERSRGAVTMGFQSYPYTLWAIAFLHFNTELETMSYNTIAFT